jgi:hypothetical protein
MTPGGDISSLSWGRKNPPGPILDLETPGEHEAVIDLSFVPDLRPSRIFVGIYHAHPFTKSEMRRYHVDPGPSTGRNNDDSNAINYFGVPGLVRDAVKIWPYGVLRRANMSLDKLRGI